MTWKTVRLELAQTREFPRGSAARAYFLRLPLESDGRIDERRLDLNPERATVRRHWPNQADRNGHVVRRPCGWAFSFMPGRDSEGACHLEPSHRLLPGDVVTIVDAEGEKLPFLVVKSEG